MSSRASVETRRSYCPLDCPDACSLEATVEDGRVTALTGTHDNPVTEGYICGKVRRFPERQHHATRLGFPLVREPGGRKGDAAFRRASWDEALDLIAERMRAARDEHGGESIFPFRYGGSNGKLTDGSTDEALFRRLGASRQLFTVCAAPTSAAAGGLYGKMPGIAFDDFVHARQIVVWGANPHASNIHLAPFLKRAREMGAELVVVDPRRTKAAKTADRHLMLRPGTDLALALAVARWLFENGRADRAFLSAHTAEADEFERRAAAWTPERASAVTGLSAAEIEAFAASYADADPALIRCGWGLERNRNGGSAAAAVLALPAIAGKFGKRGGGYTMSNSGSFAFRPTLDVDGPPTREIDMNHLGRALVELDDPPVRVLFAYNANPLMTIPDQEMVRRGLEREDLFTVVFEQVMTDTARYADVVLPATTFLEHHELSAGYGAFVMQSSEPVVEPFEEARPNYAVFADLMRRMGVWRDGDVESPRAMIENAVGWETAARLEHEPVVKPDFGDQPVQFVDVHPRTPDGKVHLVPAELDEEAPEGLYTFRDLAESADYPLALLSPATEKTVSSTFGELHTGPVPLSIHREDAEARSIEDGARVRIFNELGEVVTVARVDEDIQPGVVLLPKGIWSHNTENGRTACALSPATAADLGRGACFNDARVQVERARD